ncbi:hypothetical protein FB567DRAFT_585166 [Paraphoma chrysanthemicola]|uniref:F-box domain-containing protein n=1 Tax=Paraphoma chrysanthemicola TaxID=798071 RepID=A0A8K0VRM2_9PLEO|nr:hypothetical protein FB567DRAFT_585166 [Paraphoma chrysanthemicola]
MLLNMASFEDLSDDILYLILGHLGSERSFTLDQLRMISRRFSVFADSVLCRNIVLEEDNDAQEQATYRFIERILDPTDALRRYVRSLVVKSFKGDDASSCMNSQLLLQCVQCVAKLDSFSWHVELPIPAGLLNALETRHPCAQRCISLRHLDGTVSIPTQLHRLSVDLPCSDIVHPDSTVSFERLRNVLVQCNDLKAFYFNVHQESQLHQVDKWAFDKEAHTKQDDRRTRLAYDPVPTQATRDPTVRIESTSSKSLNIVQIPLRNTDHLPALRELGLGARTYVLDRAHSVDLLRCMDWSRLKKLTLGPSNPAIFFRTFTARLPLLETLDISFYSERQSYYPYIRQASLEDCSEFIAKLYNLKALVIRCDVVEPSNMFWHNLSLQYTYRNFFVAIARDVKSHGMRQQTCNYTKSLPTIPSLKHLQLSFKTHSGDARTLHSYVVDPAHYITRAIWSSYSALSANGDFELDTVRLRFWRWEAPSAHHDERETFRRAHINEVVFDSRRVGGQLLVKARNSQKKFMTRYTETWVRCENSEWGDSNTGEVRAQYVKELRDGTAQPFALSRRFGGLLGKALCFSGHMPPKWFVRIDDIPPRSSLGHAIYQSLRIAPDILDSSYINTYTVPPLKLPLSCKVLWVAITAEFDFCLQPMLAVWPTPLTTYRNISDTLYKVKKLPNVDGLDNILDADNVEEMEAFLLKVRIYATKLANLTGDWSRTGDKVALTLDIAK